MLQRSARQPSDLAYASAIPSFEVDGIGPYAAARGRGSWPWVLDSFAVDARSDITYGGEAFAPSWCRLAR